MMSKQHQSKLVEALREVISPGYEVVAFGPRADRNGIAVPGVRGVAVRPKPLGSALWSVVATDGGVNENGEMDGQRRVYLTGLTTGEVVIVGDGMTGRSWLSEMVEAVLRGIEDGEALADGAELPDQEGESQ